MAAEKRAENKSRNKRKAKSKEPKKKSIEDADELNLKDVLDLGGSKEDYELLKSLTAEDGEGKVKDLDRDLEKEIRDLVKSIGLDKIPVPIGDPANVDSDDEEGSAHEMSSSEDGAEDKKILSKPDKKLSSKANQMTNHTATDSVKVPEILYIPTFQKHEKTIIKQDTLWHEQIPAIEAAAARSSSISVNKLKDLAKRLWENEVAIYQEAKLSERSSDAQWLRTVLTSGTQSDKVAAITMLFQEAPVHQVKRLESLISMSKKRGRREAIMAIDSLRSLLVTDLLPERKLKYFWQWPLDKIKELVKDSGKLGEDRVLILWYFEDILKEKYSEFVESLEQLSHDTVPDIRNKATGTFFELLATKPEQEQKLLTLIVNKLGDPVRKVASRAIYLLAQLVVKHPNMKLIVIEEVERLLYRSNVSPKTQYYAICFLNQIIITKKESKIASKLISIYFSFFKVYATKRVSETKMLSALLTGVNRAFPYAQGEEEKYDEQLNMLFKVCHVSNFQTNVQALMLLFQVMDSRKSVSDRYYRVLYEKLLDHGAKTSSKHAMFLNIIYKSIKADPSMNRIKAFLKRLLQMSAYEEPSFICGLLFLISEILKARPGAKSLTMQPEEENDEEHFQDLEEDNFTAPNESNADSNHKAAVPATDSRNPGWTFRNPDLKTTSYDISNRNPLYCGAQFSCAWEIRLLLKHFHPSVSHFAESIINDQMIEYKGDPLQDFTLTRFLDRFMYKNPKKNPKDHGKSIMQPKKVSERSLEQPVNSKAFTNRKEENIREDELFFYRYFTQKAEKEASKKDKKKKGILEEELGMDEEGDVNADDFDFAGEMQRAKDQKPTKKKNKKSDEDEEEDGDESDDGFNADESDQSSGEGDFQYDDMDFSEDEDFDEPKSGGKKQKFSDADYEKALLENLSDSGDELDASSAPSQDRSSTNVNSMFAAADEFAHLLEDVGTTKGARKQASWENRGTSWKKTRKPNKRAGQTAGLTSQKNGDQKSSSKPYKNDKKNKLNHGKRKRPNK